MVLALPAGERPQEGQGDSGRDAELDLQLGISPAQVAHGVRWEAFRGVGVVYDRAALIALPPAMRKRYAERLAQRIEPGVEMLLVSLEFAGDGGPPFSVPENEIRELFEPAFTVIRLADAEVEKNRSGEAVREVAYLLHRQ